jgi:hypothetical protein
MSLISINDGVEFRIIDGNLLGSRHENVLVQRKMNRLSIGNGSNRWFLSKKHTFSKQVSFHNYLGLHEIF